MYNNRIDNLVLFSAARIAARIAVGIAARIAGRIAGRVAGNFLDMYPL